MSILGESPSTSALLKDHAVWKFIEKDAMDTNQDFYIRKYLLLLLV